MTEYTHDFENEVPEGTELVLTSMPSEEFREQSKQRMKRALEQGEAQDHYHNFEDSSDVQRILSSKRLELIVELLENGYDSISEVADAVHRDYKAVHTDLEVLSEYDVVRFDESGKGKKREPYIPYENVRVELEVSEML
jgi:predicted transcriptional regulator